MGVSRGSLKMFQRKDFAVDFGDEKHNLICLAKTDPNGMFLGGTACWYR